MFRNACLAVQVPAYVVAHAYKSGGKDMHSQQATLCMLTEHPLTHPSFTAMQLSHVLMQNVQEVQPSSLSCKIVHFGHSRSCL